MGAEFFPLSVPGSSGKRQQREGVHRQRKIRQDRP